MTLNVSVITDYELWRPW